MTDTPTCANDAKGSAMNEEKLFAGVPKEAVDSYKKAMQSAQGGNNKKAVEQLNSALAIYPKFSLALRDGKKPTVFR